MARQHGTEAKAYPDRAPLSQAIGRGLGFIILAGLGMAILAALVLIPAWANAVRAQASLAVETARTVHQENKIATRARLINATPYDPIVTRRLAKGAAVNDLVHAPALEAQPQPSGWELELADKITQTKTRRGLFFVAIVSLAGAIFLFGPPPRVRQPSHCRQET